MRSERAVRGPQLRSATERPPLEVVAMRLKRSFYDEDQLERWEKSVKGLIQHGTFDPEPGGAKPLTW